MSDDEEDSLHYHHNNRIKASEITKNDFVYFIQKRILARNWDGNLKRTPVAEENARAMTGCSRHMGTISL